MSTNEGRGALHTLTLFFVVCCHHTDYCQSIECLDDTNRPEKMNENGKLNSLTSTSSLTFRDEIHKNRNHFHRACVAPNPPIGRQNIITCRSTSEVWEFPAGHPRHSIGCAIKITTKWVLVCVCVMGMNFSRKSTVN